MKSPNRHQLRKAATHQKLIDAARDMIAKNDYNNVDILDITEHANVSKATFYKHFRNKEECVRELMHQGFDALLEKVLNDEVPATPEEALQWEYNSLKRVFLWASENRDFLLLLVGGAASPGLNQFGRTYLANIIETRLLERVALIASERADPPEIQAQATTGLLIQMVGWWLENDTGKSADDMAEILQRIIIHGLGPIQA